jgi:hypothetical protein
MEQDKLLGKLRVELEKDIKDECQVVCIMLLIRKINEIREKKIREKDKSEVLYFYCNWLMHVVLSYNNTVDYITKKFEQCIEPSNDALTVARSLKTKQQSFFNLKNLKIELKKFFEDSSLPTILCTDNKKWNQYSKLLLNIIADCPIDCSKRPGVIDKLELRKDKNGDYCYRISRKGTRNISKIKLKFK